MSYSVTIENGLLRFGRLNVSDELEAVYSLGYRFTDDRTDPFTALANRVKWGREKDVGLAAEAMKLAALIMALPSPVAVAPILGSRDRKTKAQSPVTQIAQRIATLPGHEFVGDLLTHSPHKSLHSMKSAALRDEEVLDTYDAMSMKELLRATPRCVLLVDDLVTRGSTMNDAARAIRASNRGLLVYGLAVAKTERKNWLGPAASNGHMPEAIRRVIGLAP